MPSKTRLEKIKETLKKQYLISKICLVISAISLILIMLTLMGLKLPISTLTLDLIFCINIVICDIGILYKHSKIKNKS